MPWHEAVGKEGYDVLLTMVKTGTVESRPHSKLAPGHGIPYPQNLEVRYTREKDTHTKGTENYTTNEVEEMGEQTSASFETQWQAPLSMPRSPSRSPSLHQSSPRLRSPSTSSTGPTFRWRFLVIGLRVVTDLVLRSGLMRILPRLKMRCSSSSSRSS